ncbi:MAG: sigma-70 family RNA polymerase sigma factor [Pirellulales bacterium]
MNTLGDMTVADLLVRARQGDEHGRDLLFAACRGYLQVVAAAQIEGRLQSKVDASDLVQLTMLEAFRDFERFQGQTAGEWLAWLRRIMSHNATDQVRRYRGTAKRQTGREVSISPADDSALGLGIDPAAPCQTPSQEFLLRDTELRVAAALAGLSEDHRRVILLRNLERLPFDEVARRLGRTRPAVQMLWTRAVKKLQEVLAETE